MLARCTHIQQNDESDLKPLRKNDLDRVPFWLSEPELVKDPQLGLGIFRCDSKERIGPIGPPGFMFDVGGMMKPVSGIWRAVFPADTSSSAILDFLQWALADFPLRSGYVGYSLLWNDLVDSINTRALSFAIDKHKRYPGLSSNDVYAFSLRSSTGIMHVNWITLLGPELVDKLGGRQDIERQLAPPLRR